jgi:hypothetical protein
VLFGYITVGPMLMMVKLQAEKFPPATIARYGSVDAARVAMLHDVNVGFVQKFLGVVVFLGARGPSVPYVVGFSQGVYRLVRSGDGSTWLVTPPACRRWRRHDRAR